MAFCRAAALMKCSLDAATAEPATDAASALRGLTLKSRRPSSIALCCTSTAVAICNGTHGEASCRHLHGRLIKTMERLVLVYEGLDDGEKANEWRRNLAEAKAAKN